MATLQNIRNRSVLLLSVIGIAMLAFILGDFMQSQRSGGSGSVDVGEVFGEQIHIREFDIELQKGIENWKNQNQNTVLTEATMMQIRDQVWNEYIRRLIMDKENTLLGISISDDEWMERISGVNTHSEIKNIPAFQDPKTQEFDRTKVLQYLQQIDQDETGEARERWLAFQDYLIDNIKNNKYNTLVQKSMFVTNTEARIDFNQNSQNAIFDYISIPFSSLNDTSANYNDVSNREINEYYSENIDDFQQEETRDIDFVKFSVLPSSQDDINTKQSLEDLKKDFLEVEDYLLFARRNSDNRDAKFQYSTKDELQDPAWNGLLKKSEDFVLGPYESSPGVYRISKIGSIEYRPDSVEARHILISPSATINIDSVDVLINTYKEMIEKGKADFGDLALKYSEDKGSAIKGGDLGWFKEGVMVDEFNEKCFSSSKGILSIARTQFGVHLIQVTKKSRNKKKFKIVYIDRNVEPSSETLNDYWNQASEFAGDFLNNKSSITFDSLVAKYNLVKRTDKKVVANKANVVGLPNSRSIIRWMNEAEEGDISEVFELEDSYVVAYLSKKHKEGDVPLEDVRVQIESKLKQNKKFHYIKDQITSSNNNSLEGIAKQFSKNISSIDKTMFKSSTLSGIGFEPEIVGAVFALDTQSISQPIKGRSGIFILHLRNKDEERLSGDFTQQKNQITNTNKSVASTAFNALKKKANVIDNRYLFY